MSNDELFPNFVTANTEAMEECVPKRKKTKRTSRAQHPSVVAARQAVETTHTAYKTSKSDENHLLWKQALQHLYETYDNVKESELADKIEVIEQAHDSAKYGEAWKVVNKITGRKRANEGQVNGASPTERVASWHKHFKPPGSPPEVEEPYEQIQNKYRNSSWVKLRARTGSLQRSSSYADPMTSSSTFATEH